MKAFRIYDPNRNPQHGRALIFSGQFEVTHFDYATGTWRTAEGEYSKSPEEELMFVFDSFDEAERYSRDLVEIRPGIFCRIYDHRGNPEGLVATIYSRKVAEKEHGRKASMRKLRNGALQFVFGVACVVFDWWLGGPVILGVVIGSKFLTTGVVRLVEGTAGLLEEKQPCPY